MSTLPLCTYATIFLALFSASLAELQADACSDVLTLPQDLQNPALSEGVAAPGRLVLQQLPRYSGTDVAHALYLPTDWTPKSRLPVIIEYHGNGRRVRDDSGFGFGISGGKGFIWAVLPFVSPDGKSDMAVWWGDVAATVAYAKEAVPAICREWGGDPERVILVGHSRGAIACNYIGLHDDEIAKLWRAMIPVSHYDDGHVAWGMAPEEQQRAPERLRRLGQIPQFICGEHSSSDRKGGEAKLLAAIREQNLTTFAAAKMKLGLVPLTELEGTRKFLATEHPAGRYTIVDLPHVNHTPTFVLRELPERRQMREWLSVVLRERR